MRFEKLSDLENEVNKRREAFEESKRRLASDIHEKTAPLSFLKLHPKFSVGTLLSVVSLVKLFRKKSSADKKKESSLGSKILKLGMAIQTSRVFIPILLKTLTAGTKQFSKFLSKRRPRSE